MIAKVQALASLLCAGAVLVGCEGDDTTFAPEAGAEAGGDGATKKDATVDASTKDVAKDAFHEAHAEAEAGPVPQRVLVTMNNSASSELIAVNVATKAVDGRTTLPTKYGTTQARNPYVPFFLGQYDNIVYRLDSVLPWIVDSSWNVLMNDAIDGGYPYTDPTAAVVGAGAKAYVLRYNRNDIAILHLTQLVDAGPPIGRIDLSHLLQPHDRDGTVDMVSGVFIPTKNLLYVVLDNIDQKTVGPPDYDLLCTQTVSSVIAIDTTTDKLVNIGSGPGGSIPLLGFDPVFDGTIYDPVADRLLILEAGCNKKTLADGGAGPGALVKRGVEEVDLASGATRILLDTSRRFPAGEGYPTGFVYPTLSAKQAIVGFDATGSKVFNWNPTEPKLGAKIPNAPDTFAYDGAGNLVGTVTEYPADGGASITTVVSVAIGTGDQTPLTGPNPFSMSGGFIGGVDVWPHP